MIGLLVGFGLWTILSWALILIMWRRNIARLEDHHHLPETACAT
jgi:hypothetical protein